MNFLPKETVQLCITQTLGKRVVETGIFQNDYWISVQAKNLTEVIQMLTEHSDLSFDHFVDLCGVDYLKRNPRFEVVIHLHSMLFKHRIRVRVLVPTDSLTVPSITSFWKGANWQEREAYDMYGILFEGHPELKRILNAPGTEVFPQRKDYALTGERAKKATI